MSGQLHVPTALSVVKLYQLQETIHNTLLLGCFYLLYMSYSNLSRVLLLVLSCLACNCWLTMSIVVVVLCVLLSYVYLLYYVGIAGFFFFRCQTGG